MPAQNANAVLPAEVRNACLSVRPVHCAQQKRCHEVHGLLAWVAGVAVGWGGSCVVEAVYGFARVEFALRGGCGV
jgi:hypothetical protein